MATPTSVYITWKTGRPSGTVLTYDLRWRILGASSWTVVTGIAPTSLDGEYHITGLPLNTTVEWQVRGVNGAGTSAWSGSWQCSTEPPPPSTTRYSFLSCGNGWTLMGQTTQLYGLDHLIGMYVTGLADGVVLEPQIVAPDGSITLPFPASDIKVGLAFTAQLQTPYIEAGSPTVQGRRKNIPAVTVRVDRSAGMEVGTNQPDGSAQTPQQIAPPWTNMNDDPIVNPGTYTSPGGATVTNLFTGDLRVPVTAQWAKPGQVAVQQRKPQPLNVTATIPEMVEGDTTEQGYAPRQQQQQQGGGPRGPGEWMLR